MYAVTVDANRFIRRYVGVLLLKERHRCAVEVGQVTVKQFRRMQIG